MFNMFENTVNSSIANDRLLLAATKGDLQGVVDALSNKADVNYFPQESSPLACAVNNGHTEISKILIDSGADINVCNRFKWTPLHESARQGNMELLEVLFANPMLLKNKKDVNGHSALIVAVENRHTEVAEFIIKNSSMLNAADSEGNTPLMIAVKQDDYNMAKLLLSHGASTEIYNKEGLTVSDFVGDKDHFISLLGKPSANKEIEAKEQAAILEKETQNIEKKENLGMSVITKKKRPS